MIVLYDSLPDALVCFDSDYIAGVLYDSLPDALVCFDSDYIAGVLYDNSPDALVCFDSDYIAGVLSALHVHMSPYCDYHRSFLSKKQVEMLHYMKVSDSIQ